MTKIENLPATLCKTGKFCCWQYETVKGRKTKVPYNPKTGGKAASTDPATFAPLAIAQRAQSRYNGLGVGIFEGIGAIDIDHCISDEGQPSPLAADIIRIMDAYTEKSPSGQGYRILFTVPADFDYDSDKEYYIKNPNNGVEIYVAGKTNRFVTLTGDTMTPGRDLCERGAQLRTVLSKYMKRRQQADAKPIESKAPCDLSDSEIIAKALASNDSKFQRLWNGCTVDYNSQSEADLALCSKLAFWTGRDPERIDSLFKQSGLMRDKWNRTDYKSRTIDKAIADCTEVYTPPQPKQTQPAPTVATDAPEAQPQIFTPYNVSEYITAGGYDADIEYFKKYKDRKTGFKNIDKYLTLYPGLAALGGSASLGKSTFCVNLADNLVSAGETVLYFALEQEPIELVTKSLARRLYEKDPYSPIDNIDIKNGATSDRLDTVKREYAKDADRFIYIRCDFSITAPQIREYVETYIQETNIRPIVFIDYLQLVSPPADLRGDTRAQTDYTIKEFKAMQRNNELLVILVSSFNRGGYKTPVSYEDFKETGMIEYTCDYLWALQLSILEDKDFYTKKGARGGESETDDKSKDDKLHDAMSANPKEVEFVSLKSRNGKQSYKCFFKYDMKFDIFMPDMNSPHDPAAHQYVDADNPYKGITVR